MVDVELVGARITRRGLGRPSSYGSVRRVLCALCVVICIFCFFFYYYYTRIFILYNTLVILSWLVGRLCVGGGDGGGEFVVVLFSVRTRTHTHTCVPFQRGSWLTADSLYWITQKRFTRTHAHTLGQICILFTRITLFYININIQLLGEMKKAQLE